MRLVKDMMLLVAQTNTAKAIGTRNTIVQIIRVVAILTELRPEEIIAVVSNNTIVTNLLIEYKKAIYDVAVSLKIRAVVTILILIACEH